jgi:hypothetical protein
MLKLIAKTLAAMEEENTGHGRAHSRGDAVMAVSSLMR